MATTIEVQATSVSRSYRLRRNLERFAPHIILVGYSLFALFPIFMILINSFKSRKAIFGAPFTLPNSETFSLLLRPISTRPSAKGSAEMKMP